MNRDDLEYERHRQNRIYGFFYAFCTYHKSCEDCDKWVRFGCRIKRKIETLQEKRILKICK